MGFTVEMGSKMFALITVNSSGKDKRYISCFETLNKVVDYTKKKNIINYEVYEFLQDGQWRKVYSSSGGIMMKDITEKQIDKITHKLVKERVALLKSCGFTREEISNRVSVEDVKSYVTDTIKEIKKMEK